VSGDTVAAAVYLAVAAFVAAKGGTSQDAHAVYRHLYLAPLPTSPQQAWEQMDRAWAEVGGRGASLGTTEEEGRKHE
jgi:hypothetical protein